MKKATVRQNLSFQHVFFYLNFSKVGKADFILKQSPTFDDLTLLSFKLIMIIYL